MKPPLREGEAEVLAQKQEALKEEAARILASLSKEELAALFRDQLLGIGRPEAHPWRGVLPGLKRTHLGEAEEQAVQLPRLAVGVRLALADLSAVPVEGEAHQRLTSSG